MYPKFIEVHDGADAMSINVANIEWFADETISMKNCEVKVLESYNDLKTLIQDCGCLIHKADPRLDMTHPLSMDDLKGMVGEPVWNSNTDKWLLVESAVGQYVKCKTVNDVYKYYNFSAADLIKTPLYRMKTETRPLNERLIDVLREVRGEK